MAKMKIYVVQSYIIDDWETVNEQTLVYHFKENALRTLQDIRNQDFMPIVKEEDFEIHCDTPTHFEAGYEGEYSRGCVCVKLVETSIQDYHKSE